MIRTPRTEFRAPSVIRLQHLIKRPRPRVKLSRREVFARDRHTCQYCGRQTHDLTLDHVVPRHRGGSHTWENLVTACKPCNHRKGGKTARRGAPAAPSRAVRAAQRHLLAVHAVPRRTSATTRGGPTCSWARTDARRRTRPHRPGTGDPRGRPRPARDAVVGGACRVRRGRVAARHAARPRPGRLGPRHRRPCPEVTQALLPGSVYENALRDGRGPDRRPGRRRGRDHDVPLRPRLRRPPPAAPGRVHRFDRARPRPA